MITWFCVFFSLTYITYDSRNVLNHKLQNQKLVN